MTLGLGPYILVCLLTCAALAAVMSTADSVIMGVSNTLSVDLCKHGFAPNATPEQVVRCGGGVSCAMTIIAVVAGTYVTSSEFGLLLTLQNGLLMQILPSFALGLFIDVSV
eukprot:CAMPEP_0180544772 /NCGR_PEP_ID=MMETSP1036_2-20121128/69687_1 /TAXON_ID=632150 /ORGANISM="Azadinium spinosum, Strain 3D9" /LENGTH=110 /DNA_ID=CAMNT_0022559775 /DNA_START=1 /DNA_END=330 /DNA_ORIENTATION=+